jgi:hypothetical protein
MNKKNLIVIILIVVGVLVIAGGVWIWQSRKEKPVVCPQDTKLCPDGSYVSRTGPNCEFAVCPEAKDETANWKTYRNEKFGIELKYPEKWLLEVKDNPSMPPGCIQRTYLRKDITSANIDILIFANPSKIPIKEWLSQQGAEGPFENTSLNTIFALKSDKSDSSSYLLYLANGNYVYMIDIVKFSDKAIVDIQNRILSTFKFTE